MASGGARGRRDADARNREVRPAFQGLVYPMLDDRTTLRTNVDPRALRLWGPASNRYGWASYLGRDPGGDDVPAGAAPARHPDLAGLPPTWMGVGTRDLFHDEDLAYAGRLREAGVACDLEVVQGAFHGFYAVARTAAVTRAFHASLVASMRRALFT